MRQPRRCERLTLVLAGIALSAALGACTSSHTPAKSAKALTTTTSRATESSTTMPGPIQVPFDPTKNARADVVVKGSCTHTKGVWVLRGIVQNPKHATTGFSIVVDYVRLPGDTVLDTQIVKVKPVAYRQTAHWKASWASSKQSLTCVVRQAETR